MGRHSLPDAEVTERGRSRARVRRRTTVAATAPVLGVAAGAGAAVRSGLLSFAGSCRDSAVRIDLAASTDIAGPQRRRAARAHECLALRAADGPRRGHRRRGDGQAAVPAGVRLGHRGRERPGTRGRGRGGGRSPPGGRDPADARLWTITVHSARLTTVVDVSGSMQTPVPGQGTETRLDVTRALRTAPDQFTPEDEIGLWEFATGLDGANDYREVVPTDPLGPADSPAPSVPGCPSLRRPRRRASPGRDTAAASAPGPVMTPSPVTTPRRGIPRARCAPAPPRASARSSAAWSP